MAALGLKLNIRTFFIRILIEPVNVENLGKIYIPNWRESRNICLIQLFWKKIAIKKCIPLIFKEISFSKFIQNLY